MLVLQVSGPESPLWSAVGMVCSGRNIPASSRASSRSWEEEFTVMRAPHRVVVLGTHNRKKGRELADLFGQLGLELKTLADIRNPLQVEEVGASFAENAGLKACQQAMHLQQWVLAEDSGLLVDALDGHPGIRSARYAGPDATDDANIDRLLRAMHAVPADNRGGHYVSHMTLADPEGNRRVDVDGSCHGRITRQPRGSGGFGYDPVFEILEYHMTFGELGDAVKEVLSHRGRAARRMLRQIATLLRSGRRDDGEGQGVV